MFFFSQNDLTYIYKSEPKPMNTRLATLAAGEAIKLV